MGRETRFIRKSSTSAPTVSKFLTPRSWRLRREVRASSVLWAKRFHSLHVWRRSSCYRRSWDARPGSFERARYGLQLVSNFHTSKRKTQLEFGLTRVRGNPHSPKSAVRGRHVRCFESTWQISNRSIYSHCAQLFVLRFVSGARFLELEVRLRKKQRRQVLRIPKGAHTKAPPRYHVSSSRQLMTGVRLLNSSS